MMVKIDEVLLAEVENSSDKSISSSHSVTSTSFIKGPGLKAKLPKSSQKVSWGAHAL